MINKVKLLYRKLFWSYEKSARYQGVKIVILGKPISDLSLI